MSIPELFVEIFPVEPAAVPALRAYILSTTTQNHGSNRMGARLAARLRRTYAGVWLWLDGRLVTDSPLAPDELAAITGRLKEEQPDLFGTLDVIIEDSAWQPSAQTTADFALRALLQPLESVMSEALSRAAGRLRNAHVEREHKLQAWSVRGRPSVSISIASRLIYDQDAAAFIGADRNRGADREALHEKLAGLWVSDKLSALRGEIVGISGTAGQHRQRLLEYARSAEMRTLIENAPDDEPVLVIRAGQDEYEYIAGALRLIVRLPDVKRFDVDSKQAVQTLQMKPALRAQAVKSVSDIAKEAGALANAFNSRGEPDLFFSADFEMNLRFAQNRVRPYSAEKLPEDFSRCGVYKLREAFLKAPVRVAVVNTLAMKLEDFVEALQRYLRRHFEFQIDVIRERRVRVVSRANLESAVRVVEKDDPDLIMAFFPDDAGAGDDDDTGDEDATAAYMKSLTLGRGLPTHVIYQSMLDDPDAMPSIVLSILGRTGSAPFVLAEPLEYADVVAGLSLVRTRRKTTGEIRLTAVARIYKADGEFLRYAVRELVSQDETPPYLLLRDLFPQREFARKRIIVHHDGPLPDDLFTALTGWGKAIGASFYPVEIMRFGAPRIYGLSKGGVCQPPWGSAFKLNDNEALLVSSVPAGDVTPQPLRIRTRAAGEQALAIEKALRGVLVWSLLAYGAQKLPKLPVTVNNADALAYWLAKGNTFSANEGLVPFWL